MKLFRLSAVLLVTAAGYAVLADEPAKQLTPVPAAPANPADKFETTHKVVDSISVKGEKGMTLQTLCLDGNGRVVGLVAPPKPYGAPVKGATAEIHLFDADGKPVEKWNVPFHATAVNCGTDGTIYVAGDGKIAKFDKDGKQIGKTTELPHLTEIL
jgi:hypothetical protein